MNNMYAKTQSFGVAPATTKSSTLPNGQPRKRYVEHPDFRSSVSLSKDGRYIIHKLTITTFKPVSFLQSSEGRAS